MAKAPASGITLDYRDTRTVKGMLLRGDRQHDIASYFGVNGARISEIANGSNNYPNADPLPEADLPPPGPYLSKYALQSIIDTLNEAIEALDLAEAENEIADVKAALILARQTIQNKIDLLQEV
jgi:transcriptional regulator with XRE-family HTH domain